jgi:glycosyltransferase involved in cell wall biosynthesis
MNVLIFSTVYFPLVGGAEVAMNEVTDRIPDVHFDLICAQVKPGLPKVEKIGNITVHRCGSGHPIDKYLLPILGVVRAMKVTSHESRVTRSNSGTRDSRLVTRDFPVIWSLMASFGGLTALVFTWFKPNAKMLLTLQEGDPLEHYVKRAHGMSFLQRMIFKRANTIQAISHFLAKWGTDMGFKGTPEIVPNGVDIAKFAAQISPERRKTLRTSFGFSDEDVILVTASRLSLKNAVDDLIKSLVDLPVNYKALIAGDGEDREMLHALVKELKLESRVVFLGSKTHDELPELLQASEIFVRASLSEGLGNSFLEAMAAGIPIIGTPVGGIVDFLTDGETGVFCQPRDPSSLAKATLRIQSEPGLREKLIVQGEKVVRERYDWDKIAKQVKHGLDVLAAI